MTIILLSSQKHDKDATRSFNHFNKQEDMVKEIVDYYEEYLQVVTPENSKEYMSEDLFEFLDKFFEEIVCLVLDKGVADADLWIPHDVVYIKQVIYDYFKKLWEETQTKDKQLASDMDTLNMHNDDGNINDVFIIESEQKLAIEYSSNTDQNMEHELVY